MRVTFGVLAGSLSLLSACNTTTAPLETRAGAISAAAAPAHKSWYVAAGGRAGAAGTVQEPWSMAYAVTGAGGKVAPGDTVWLRGGNYQLGVLNSTVAGTASAPVIFRARPGERATLDMSLNITGGGYVWFWGLDVKQADGSWQDRQCFNVLAPGVRLINNIVHDCSGNGVGMWVQAPNSEATGNLLYNNGRYGAAVGRYAHGFYLQNATGTKLIRQNVVMNTFSHAFHGYTDSEGQNNYTIEDNVAVNAGQFVDYGGREYLLGGYSSSVHHLIFRRNQAFRAGGTAATSIGYYSGTTTNPSGSQVTDNYLASSLEVYRFAGLTVTGNTLINHYRPHILRDRSGSTWAWNNNHYFRAGGQAGEAFAKWDAKYASLDFTRWKTATGFDGSSSYSGSTPTGQRVTVLKNPYEPGRAFVVVWNWSGAGSATVDLSGVLRSGQAYEVRNAQRVWDAAVATGTSSSVTFRLSAVTPYVPVGNRHHRLAQGTGTVFHVFLVTPKP